MKNDGGSKNVDSGFRDTLLQNARNCPASIAIVFIAAIIGIVEYFCWGRTHWEDGIPLIALLLLAIYDNVVARPFEAAAPTAKCRLAGWGMLVAAIVCMALSWPKGGFVSPEIAEGPFFSASCKSGALFFLAMAIILQKDGAKVLPRCLPLLALALVVLPLYEFLLLQFSYPLRVISTAASAWLLRICGMAVSFSGTEIVWSGQLISITDACSGISLLGLLFLVEYLIARTIKIDAWKKWCWSSLVILWIIISNAIRLVLTFVLYRFIGERVFEQTIHFTLGCLFVVIASLLIWFSSFIFQLDEQQSADHTE